MIDNFIYLDICEILYKEGFKRSKFTTFSSYCTILKLAISKNEVNGNDFNAMVKLYQDIGMIYHLTDKEVTSYLRDFLSLDPEDIHKFFLCVISSKAVVFNQ